MLDVFWSGLSVCLCTDFENLEFQLSPDIFTAIVTRGYQKDVKCLTVNFRLISYLRASYVIIKKQLPFDKDILGNALPPLRPPPPPSVSVALVSSSGSDDLFVIAVLAVVFFDNFVVVVVVESNIVSLTCKSNNYYKTIAH